MVLHIYFRNIEVELDGGGWAKLDIDSRCCNCKRRRRAHTFGSLSLYRAVRAQ